MPYVENVTNGECFLRGVQICLHKNYGKETDEEQLKMLIMSEVHKNAEEYKHFHSGDAMKVIVSTFEYLKYCTFAANVVDIVIPCTANALKTNLFIYTHGSAGKTILLSHFCKIGSDIDIYLKYDRLGGNYHGADHCTPLVILPGMFSSTLSTNPPITTVCTNTKHPPYIRSEEEKDEEEENIWAVPPSLAGYLNPGHGIEGIEETYSRSGTTSQSPAICACKSLFTSHSQPSTSSYVCVPPSSHTCASTPTNKLLGFSPIDSPASTPSYKALHFVHHDSCASTPPNKALDSRTSTPTNKPLFSGPRNSLSILHNTCNGISSSVSANVPALPQDDTVTDGPNFTLSQQSAAEEIDQEKIVYDIIDGCKEYKMNSSLMNLVVNLKILHQK